MIYDDGDEATVVIEHVTHHHATCDDADLSDEDRARRISEDVVDFLRDLFSDRVLLWSLDRGRRGGGWHRPYDGKIPAGVPLRADLFVWSRRVKG